MQEQIVKLAEEKGYNKFHPDWFENNKINPDSWLLELFLIQKWLRDMHKLHITIWFNFLTNKYRMDEIMNLDTGEEKHSIEKEYSTFEETFEMGIFETLKLI